MVKSIKNKKINLIAILQKYLKVQDIILLVLVFGTATFFFFFFYRKAEFVEVKIKVTDQDVLYATTLPKPWYANQFETGDTEIDAIGNIITELIDVETVPVSKSETAVYLTLNVKATYNTRTDRYTVKGRDLIFGAPIRFNLGMVTFDGIVVDFPGLKESDSYEYRIVTALVRSVEPYVAESIHIGDQVINNRGEVLIELVDIDVTSADMVVTTDSGEVLLQKSPLHKDVIVKAKVRVKKVKDLIFLLEDLPFGVGQALPINLDHTSLFPTISSISEATQSAK